jgi:hypothetical protein
MTRGPACGQRVYQEYIMAEQTTQRPSPESVLPHELNHRVNNEFAAAVGVASLAAAGSGNDKLSAMDRHAEFDARDGEHFSSDINVSSESVGQRKAAKIPPRTRILSAAAKLFLRHGIAGVNVEAIAKAAAARSIDAGMFFINHGAWTAPELQFGGVKSSGFGRELGELGIHEFVNKKLIQCKTQRAAFSERQPKGFRNNR